MIRHSSHSIFVATICRAASLNVSELELHKKFLHVQESTLELHAFAICKNFQFEPVRLTAEQKLENASTNLIR